MVQRALTRLGYHVDAASSGQEALERIQAHAYHLVLLDIRMPGFNGVDVMRHLRREHPDLLIIVLTGHASMESAIAALRLGAVDYLLKPVSLGGIEEALQRVLNEQAQGHSPHAPATDEQVLLHVGPLVLHRENYVASLTGDDASIQLTPSEAALLGCLMRQAGAAVSCQQLAHDALGYEVGEPEAREIVRPHISRIRRKIERDPQQPALVETVPNQGYRYTPYGSEQ
jgi:two-component system KDP operon response regulator KdpE